MRERTRIQSRIRWHLHALDPSLHVRSRGLRSQRVVDRLVEHLDGREGTLVEIVRKQLARVRELNQRALELERQIMLLVIRLAPSLLTIPGCGALTAAKIVGETAGVGRFHSKSAYARWNGTAPPTRLVGQQHALSTRAHWQPAGQLGAAPDRDHAGAPPRAYFERRIEQGNTPKEATR